MDEHRPSRPSSHDTSPALAAGRTVSSESWRALLQDSSADPLFLDWSWQQLWWETYASELRDAELATFLVQNADAQPTCIANLYFQQVDRLPLSSFRSLQFVGGAWRNGRTMLTEYLEPIAARGERTAAFATLLEEIALAEWDEFVIELTPADGAFAQAVRASCASNDWYLREQDRSEAHHVALHDGFPAYTRALSGNARRRLLNNRSRLRRHGHIEIKHHLGAAVAPALELLNALHACRWGEPVFNERRLAFLTSLHHRLPADIQPIVSVIEANGEPISALYDIRSPQRQYNIQMGFDPRFDKSISLGLLHLGYAMEDAVAAGVVCYDLLAGAGRSTDYKTHISTSRTPLVTLQVVRNTHAKMIYRLRDSLAEYKRR